MSRERFVLFYTAPDGRRAAGELRRDSESLVRLVARACRLNFRRGEGARALRIERGGRVVLDEAALLRISVEAAAVEEAERASDPAVREVNLRETVFLILRGLRLVDGRGGYTPPDDSRA